ncbi:hypothetical protein SAMN05660284_02479 [Formivibrio citricus]|uniref:Uncharacterized protein n=1 Tax=Formivibrio citricus TaxID=83765 RepID=A0A1I5CT87_9NEIS|nr:hypothetical protein SAMN05660284_02479 [Formivibrio citricus]
MRQIVSDFAQIARDPGLLADLSQASSRCLAGIFLQPAIPHLHIPKLTLLHPELVLDLHPHTREQLVELRLIVSQ